MAKRKKSNLLKSSWKESWDDTGEKPVYSIIAGIALIALVFLKVYNLIGWLWFIVLMIGLFILSGVMIGRGEKK